ncbi:MAG: EpsG family protein [Clostridia bacterium]|nr:EpsG family protein [Clostridia bacterium]
MVYHLVLAFCFFAAWLVERYAMNTAGLWTIGEKKEKSKAFEKKLYLFVALYMVALCGFRAYGGMTHVGIDTYGYYTSYINKIRWNLSDIFQEDVSDKGYVLLEWCLSNLGVSFWVVLLLSAVVYVGAMAIYIYRYSQNRWMSLFIFVAMGLYTFAFSAIRQSIAMGICMGAYMLSQKVSGWKGFLGFVVLVWLASTIHASAIVFLPVYFLGKLPYRNTTIILMLGIAAITMLFKNQFANLIVQLAAETSDKYESYEMVENAGAGMLLYLFVLMTIVLRLLVSGGMAEAGKTDNSAYFLLFMLILFPAVQSGGAMMRIYYYYYMFLIVYLPNMLESIEDRKTKQLAYVMLSFFLIYFYITMDRATLQLVPYQFFWQ